MLACWREKYSLLSFSNQNLKVVMLVIRALVGVDPFIIGIFFVGIPSTAAPFVVFFLFHRKDQVALVFLIDCARVDRRRNGPV